MNLAIKYPTAIAAVFIWIGFVGAISFMEAWLKFRVPGITLPLGLGIGRLVFGALNKVELVLSVVIIASMMFSGVNGFKWKYLFFLVPFLTVIVQSLWLLPALDVRAEMHIQDQAVPTSNLHFYYVGMEVVKVVCLLIFGIQLFKIKELFTASANELSSHMHKEEKILFLVIRAMVEVEINGTSNIQCLPFGMVGNTISTMTYEHDSEGERFRKIAALTNGYTPPEDACTTYRVTFALLEKFEEDLHQHIHLENNILFPKALELEKSYPVPKLSTRARRNRVLPKPSPTGQPMTNGAKRAT